MLHFADGRKSRSNSKIIIQPPLFVHFRYTTLLQNIPYFLWDFVFRWYWGKKRLTSQGELLWVRRDRVQISESEGLILAFLSQCVGIGWEMGVMPPVLPSPLGLPEAERAMYLKKLWKLWSAKQLEVVLNSGGGNHRPPPHPELQSLSCCPMHTAAQLTVTLTWPRTK